jgi:hypothetical protein
MDVLKAQHAAAMGEMEAKLRWYVDNQGLLTANDALLAQQRDAIRDLQLRLRQYEGTLLA